MFKNAEELVEITLKKVQDTANNVIKRVVIPTGFKKLDNLIYGWKPSNLIVIASRPGMGKTAFIASMVKNMAIQFNTAIAIFSLELSSVQLMSRMLSAESGVSLNKINNGNLEPHEWELLNVKSTDLAKAPLFFNDTKINSVYELCSQIYQAVNQHNCKVILIDYIQLVPVDNIYNDNRPAQEKNAFIFGELKATAIELNVPIIVLSQLPRDIDERLGNKRPLLSDFYKLGDLNKFVDVVSFFYRPEYYGMTEWDIYDQTSCIKQAELILAKHPYEILGNIRFCFRENYLEVYELEE